MRKLHIYPQLSFIRIIIYQLMLKQLRLIVNDDEYVKCKRHFNSG